MFVSQAYCPCRRLIGRRAKAEKKMFDTSDTGDVVTALVTGWQLRSGLGAADG